MTERLDIYQLSTDMTPSFIFENRPPTTEINSLTNLLDQAKKAVQSKWVDYMVETILNLDDPHKKSIIQEAFPNVKQIQNLLTQENFHEFERLRSSGGEELWREIIAGISEREVSVILQAKSWLENMSENEISLLPLSKSEIILFLDLALDVQLAIDSAYIQQLKLSDTTVKKKETTPQPDKLECEYLYDDQTPYIEVFPEEFGQLVASLVSHSKNINHKINTKELPASYSLLSEYLLLLAKGYGSKETDPKKISQMWDTIETQFLALSQSDLPFFLNPWGFPTDDNHIGIELMVTLNLESSSPWYNDGQEYLSTVSDFMIQYQKDFRVSPFVHQYIFTRNGINLPWSGTACAGDNYIVFFDNENYDFASNLYKTYYHQIIDGTTTEERFVYARGVSTIAHEAGHLPRMIDSGSNVGAGLAINKLDECKADTMASLLYLHRINTSQNITISPEEFIEQFIVDYIDDIKSAKWHASDNNTGVVLYDFSAKAILLKLFESNSILWNNNKIKIVDGLSGVATLATLGQEIFDLYGSPSFDSHAVSEYVKILEFQFSQNQNLQKFLNKISTLN